MLDALVVGVALERDRYEDAAVALAEKFSTCRQTVNMLAASFRHRLRPGSRHSAT